MGFEKCAESAWLKGSVACGLLLASLATPPIGRAEVEGTHRFTLLCDRPAGENSDGHPDEIRGPEAEGRKSRSLIRREGITALAFRNRTAFTPYLGAGIGPASESPDEYVSEQPQGEADPNADYRLGAGLDCALDDSTRLGLGYRVHRGGIPGADGEEDEGGAKASEGVHHFSIGIEKKF